MKKKYLIYGGIGLLLVVIGIVVVCSNEESTPNILVPATDGNIYQKYYVIEIKGEVNKPGIYFVNESYRISDCILLAAGLTKNADTSSLNLAAKVNDGMQILIPLNNQGQIIENNKVSINNASLDELVQLPGIGSAIAQNIIDYREKNNGFKTIEEIKEVSRISETLFAKIKELITL